MPAKPPTHGVGPIALSANTACRSVSLPRSRSLHAARLLGLPRILRAELLPVRFLRVVSGRGRREQEVRADERQRHEKSANRNGRYPHSGTAFPFLACRSFKKTSGNEFSAWISMAAPTH